MLLFDEMFYLIDAFYFAMHFILIYLKLYLNDVFYLNLFKALFNLRLFIPTPFPSISNNFYPFLSNSKNFKQTLSIACL